MINEFINLSNGMNSAQTVIYIINKLKGAGFTAFIAGGAVRDLILSLSPKDFDIVSDATPDQVEKIFPQTKNIGKEFGVIIVIEKKQVIEVATFRSDLGYSDNRRPDEVKWSSPEDDAKRRDFTINALFLDPEKDTDLSEQLIIQEIIEENNHLAVMTNLGKVIDYVGGLHDLEQRILRFVGDAGKRINEDHLRIIRAVRFKAEYNLEYAERVIDLLKKNIDKIQSVSPERIRDELEKMLKSPYRSQAIKELDEIGALKLIIPDLEPLKKIEQSKKFYQTGNAFDHVILVLAHLPKQVDVDIVWAALLHDIGKAPTMIMGYDRKNNWTERFPNHNVVGAEMAKKILTDLKFPNERIERILWLVTNHQMPPEITRMREGKQRRWLLDPRLPDLLVLHKADAMGKEKKVYLGWHDQVKKMMAEELAKPAPPPKLIDGHEIMKEFNLEPGPEIGRLLKIVDDAVWDNKISTKEEALDLVKKNL